MVKEKTNNGETKMRTWIEEIIFNDTLYRKFKKRYLEAKASGEKKFKIEGLGEFLTTFAKYSLEYIEGERVKRKLKIYFEEK